MQRSELVAQTRDGLGKGFARRLRVSGKVPAVLYGKQQTPIGLAVEQKSITKVLGGHAGLNVLIDLAVDGKPPVVARVREYQVNPLKQVLTHVDFVAVDMNQPMDLEIAIHFEGSAHGVKEGGILEASRRMLHVRCLPSKIPDYIAIDISGLGIGESIHANDVKLPEGVEFPHAENFSIVQVVTPQKEEVAAPVAAVAAATAATPAAGAAATPATGAPAAAAAKPAAKPGK